MIRRHLLRGLVMALGLSLSGTGFSNDLKNLTNSWQSILDRFLEPDGRVDYQGLNKVMPELEAFIKGHQGIDFSTLGDNTKKAAYINLYNAKMMFNILRYAKEEKIDVASKKFTDLKVNDIRVPGGNIWNGDYKANVSGYLVNLDNIEHAMIRGKDPGKLEVLKVSKLDPRIHAAVNCAALSCPPVRKTAYTKDNIDQLLDDNIRAFVSSEDHFYKASDSKMVANSIVFWYYGDFEDHAKADKNFTGAGDYLASFVSDQAKDRDWKIKHFKENFNDRSKFSLKISSAWSFDYDWQINDKRNTARKLK